MSAVTVTGCGYIQLLVVKVSDAPAMTDRPELPDVRPTATVTFPDGAADSDTPNTSLVPWATENVPGSATSVPVALVEVSVTVTVAPA